MGESRPARRPRSSGAKGEDRVLGESGGPREPPSIPDAGSHLRDLFERAPIGLVRTRFDDGRVVAANPEALRMFGLTDPGALDEGLMADDRYVEPAARLRLRELLLSGEEVRGFEAEFRRFSDGTRFWLRMSATWHREEGYIQTVLEDITDRKQAEQALRESEERFRGIFDAARDCIFVKNLELRYTHVNPAMAQLFECTEADLVGTTDGDLFDAETAAALREVDLGVLAGEVREDVGRSFVGGRGQHVFHTVKVPVRDQDGRVTGLCGIARNVGELKRAEKVERVLGGILLAAATSADLAALISRIRELLATLIDTTNFYVALYEESTARYSFPYYTDEYDELERFEPEPLPHSLTDYVRRTGRAVLLDREGFDELERRGEVRLVGTDSEQWVGAPLVTERGVIGVVAVQSYHDSRLYSKKDAELLAYAAGTISIAVERKRAEEQRRVLEAKVLQIQKMESLGVLAGGIAHEFNNLLQAILGGTGLATRLLPAESPVHRQLELIEKAANHAAKLTHQMLAYSGKSGFLLEEFDLTNLVAEMKGLLEASAGDHVDLRFELAQGLPSVEVDAAEIRQVVTSLVSNAVEAIEVEQGGDVVVKTGAVRCTRSFLARTLLGEELPEGTYVALTVTDSGCGMDARTTARIFDPFFSTKFTGRGLGLAAVLGIVRGVRGALRVESAPGKGTSVQVLLPVVFGDTTVEAPPRRSSIAAAHHHEKLTVLVVDDDEVIRSLARQMLLEAGFGVDMAADGEQAVEVFERRGSGIDVVLLDLTMPNLDGRQTFDRLRELRQDVPVIIASGFSEQDAMDRFRGAKPSAYLQKPYRLADLVGVVQRVCAS